ncbi:MAG: alanyl-tRNA editing protein [Cohaesibacteraceae bacterium]
MEALFQSDSYLRSADILVDQITEDGIVVTRSLFYPQGGGQPGDQGTVELSDGTQLPVLNTRYTADRSACVLVLREGEDDPLPDAAAALSAGSTITGHIDWPLRYRFMRVHTALHLLSVVLPYPVTGGQISDGQGRLDFDISDAGLDKDALTEHLQTLVDADHAVTSEWITDAQLDAQPELVKTMSVKPPRGSGKVRLIRIGDIDLQPCGGTHVQSTAEIGPVAVTKIEKKGKQNRRVRIKLMSDQA